MKFKILCLLLLVMIQPMVVHAVSFRDCEAESGDRFSSRDIENPTNYSIIPGFGVTTAFTPDEIELSYASQDCTGDIAEYHAHNTDSVAADQIETNINISTENGSILSVIQRVNSDSSHLEWIISGKMFFLNDYSIALDETATSGDPFDGISNNTQTKIGGMIQIGTVESPCRFNLQNNVLSFTNREQTGPCQARITARSLSTDQLYQYTAELKIENLERELPADTALYN